MMDVDIVVPVAFFATTAFVAVGLPLARAAARRMDRQAVSAKIPPELTQRLERMEQAIDAIAVEVERISEGQRFTTRLLSDRQAADSRALPASPGGGS
jgi:hypothetical protein